ncbi:MAG: sodium:solute symporter family protein [bacterium]
MAGIHPIDIAIVAVYLAAMIVIGLWTSRTIKTQKDFFVAGRRLNKFLQMMINFGTGTHTDQAVIVASKSYDVGISGIWYQWLWMFVTPFYWMIAPIIRRMRCITCADFFHERFSKGFSIYYTFVGIMILIVDMGIMLLATGITVEGMTKGAIPSGVAVLGMTFLFVFYGVLGGLLAAAITDSIQGVLTIVLSFLLIPFLLHAVGGMSGLHEKLAPEMFDLIAAKGTKGLTLFWIIMVSFNGLVGIVVQPHTMPTVGAGRTEMDCRVGQCFGNYLKRFCTVAWAFIGIGCVALYSLDDLGGDSELAFGRAVTDLLPVGFSGLMLISILAAVMSTCDALMVSGSALFTNHVYAKFLKPGRTESHYIRVGRLVSIVIVACGLAFAYCIPNAKTGLEIFWRANAIVGIAFWLGIMWRRTNVFGAWASSVVALLVWAAIHIRHTLYPDLPVIPLQWEMLYYLSAGFLAGIVGSWLTRPPDTEQTRALFDKLATPVTEDETD